MNSGPPGNAEIAGTQEPGTQKPGTQKNPATSAGFFLSQSALDRIRTYGLLLRRQPLYPLSYEGKDAGKPAGPVGLKKLSRSGAPCENAA